MSLCIKLKHCRGEALKVFGSVCCCQCLSYNSVHCLLRQTYLSLAALTSYFFTRQCLFMSDYLTSLLSEYKKVPLFSRRYGNWLQAIVSHQKNKCLSVLLYNSYSTLTVKFYCKNNQRSGAVYDGYIVSSSQAIRAHL